MKKIFFSLCIVLVVLFMPAYSYALENTPSHDFKIVKHNQLYISNNTHDVVPYFDAVLLEEDNDASTSEKEKFSPEKNALTICFIATNFPDNSFKNTWPARHFLNCSQPGLIYFRVLRL
jgi:hypothetical protein